MGIVSENTAPGTEFPRVFCVGIGPLQLGIVLVLFFINIYYFFNTLEQKCSKLEKSLKMAFKTYRIWIAFLSSGMGEMVPSHTGN